MDFLPTPLESGDTLGRRGPTVFALGDVAALVAALRVGGVAPGSDTIPVGVPAVVQLQTVGVCGSPPGKSRITLTLRIGSPVRRSLRSQTSHL